MKSKLLSLAIVFLSASIVIADINKRQEVFFWDYGDRNSGTINRVLNMKKDVDTTTFVLSGGSWTVTNNITFPTNSALRIAYGSSFAVDNGSTVALPNVLLYALDQVIFTGAGNATGDAAFFYRWPNWGDTTRFDIGDGILSEAQVEAWIENGDLSVTGNVTVVSNLTVNGDTTLSNLTVNGNSNLANDTTVSNLTINGTLALSSSASGTVFDAVTNAAGWDAAVQGVAGVTNTDTLVNGYINECLPTYVSTNSITIGTGDGMCNENYFAITSAIPHTIASSIYTGTGFVHIAINDSGSTYPNSITLYDTLTDPVYVPALAGWYISTSQTDRVLATLRYHEPNGGLSGNSTNVYSDVGGKLRIQGDWALTLQQNVASDGNLNATTTSASNFLPVNASAAWVQGRGAHAANNCEVFFAGNGENIEQRYEAYDEVGGTAWVTLDETRIVYSGGATGDDAALDCTLLGYEVRR